MNLVEAGALSNSHPFDTMAEVERGWMLMWRCKIGEHLALRSREFATWGELRAGALAVSGVNSREFRISRIDRADPPIFTVHSALAHWRIAEEPISSLGRETLFEMDERREEVLALVVRDIRDKLREARLAGYGDRRSLRRLRLELERLLRS